MLNTFFRRLTLAAMGAGSALAQAQPDQAHPLNTANPFIGDLSSFYNREVLYMSIPAIVMSILIFIGTASALFYSVYKYRERKGETRPASQFHGNNVLEIALIAVPFVIVTIIAVLTVRTMVRLNSLQVYDNHVQGAPVQVDVLGAQFWWNFTYPELGGFANGNEMVVPATNPLRLQLTARDVMHQFWASNLGGQRTAIPGVKVNYTIDIEKPGIYQGHCSLLCGPSHANMRYKVAVLPQGAWNDFVEGARNYKAPAPTTASEQQGYQIFMNGKNGSAACSGCHRVQGTPANGQAGPDLSFFGTRRTLGADMWEGEAARANLHAWIRNCPGIKPGCLMPAFPQLTDADINNVEAYLRSLKLPESADYWRSALNR